MPIPLFLFIAFSVSISQFISLFITLPVFSLSPLSNLFYFFMYLFLSLSPSLYLFFSLFLSFSFSLSPILSLSLSVYLNISFSFILPPHSIFLLIFFMCLSLKKEVKTLLQKNSRIFLLLQKNNNMYSSI